MEFAFDDIETKTLSDAGVDMPVKRLDGSPLRAANGGHVSLRMLGPDSAAYRRALRKQVRRRVLRQDAGSVSDADFDEMEEDTLDMLAACTAGWKNVLDKSGAEIPFSQDNARILYTIYPVIREQVDAFVASRANFLRGSANA